MKSSKRGKCPGPSARTPPSSPQHGQRRPRWREPSGAKPGWDSDSLPGPRGHAGALGLWRNHHFVLIFLICEIEPTTPLLSPCPAVWPRTKTRVCHEPPVSPGERRRGRRTRIFLLLTVWAVQHRGQRAIQETYIQVIPWKILSHL